MPASLPFEAYGEGIGNATSVLRNNAAIAGLGAPVPTCPGWTVAGLVSHQGLVHRWATSIVTGAEPRPDTEVEAEAAAVPDLLEWLDDGMVDLVNALALAPADLAVMFFLHDAGPAREAWARRQCHETTIHAVDAMTARLGRLPSEQELWFGDDLALDGIDELLLGFLPRRKTRLRFQEVATVVVAPDNTTRTWTIDAGPDHARASVGSSATPELVIGGSPRRVYLALWNRGEPSLDGDRGLFERYRTQMRVEL